MSLLNIATLYFIGTIFLFVGLDLFVTQVYRHNYWIHAIGTVIEIREKENIDVDGGEKTTMYCAVLAYYLPGETEVFECQSPIWTSPCQYVIGQKIPILINPRNPKHAHSKNTITMSLVILGAGISLLVTAING